MRILWIALLAALPAFAQNVDIAVRPDAVYVEAVGGNIVPMERVFFHIVIDNQSKAPIDVQWVRFDMTNSKGVVFSAQYGYYAHLKPFSIAVKRGANVREGEVLGEVGNSGDSSEPHLHFHVMNGPDATQADGIPVVFENWKAQSQGRVPAARQQGVLPRGEFVSPP